MYLCLNSVLRHRKNVVKLFTYNNQPAQIQITSNRSSAFLLWKCPLLGAQLSIYPLLSYKNARVQLSWNKFHISEPYGMDFLMSGTVSGTEGVKHWRGEYRLPCCRHLSQQWMKQKKLWETDISSNRKTINFGSICNTAYILLH